MNARKDALRRTFLAYRQSLSAEEKSALDALIAERVLRDPAYLSAQTVFCYVSLPQEIDTAAILADARHRGKRIAVPRCRPHGQMEFYSISSRDELKPGIFGIPEPTDECSLCLPVKDDLCIVPCLAADRNGSRLGYGGGYYDRYLSAHPMHTICLCYSACLVDALVTESFDVPIERIMTDKEVK